MGDLLFVNVGLLIMGSFLEPPAAILILTPLILPMSRPTASIRAFRHHHGGQSQPRHVHAALRAQSFRVAGDLRRKIGTIYRGVVPFVAINFATLMMITYVPAVSMVLLGHAQ